MSTPADLSNKLKLAITDARDSGGSLGIVSGGSKSTAAALGGDSTLDISGHRGIVAYQPTELVVTVRAGTPVAELDAALDEQGQMLACEWPDLGGRATVGGSVATGIAGPRRPYGGGGRDVVLGVRLINGLGEVLSFGGQVMKNVAGYDLSRLMVGSRGCLGVLLDVSLKLVPQAPRDITQLITMPSSADAATYTLNLIRQSMPVSASCYHNGQLWLRLSGSESALNKLDLGPRVEEGDDLSFWQDLKNRELPFFNNPEQPLWRIALPEGIGELPLDGQILSEWHGCLRWYRGGADNVRQVVSDLGGFAQRMDGDYATEPAPVEQDPVQQRWHERLRAAFDPDRVFNPALNFGGATGEH